MSLLRSEDYVPCVTSLNFYWAELLRSVDEFDQLMDLQKRQIATCIKQFNLKRTQLVRQFSQFKDSMRFQGEVPKREVFFVQMSEFSSIFKGYHHFIVDIIEKIVLQPKILAELLSNFVDIKKLKFQDFLQNIVFNIYPYYLPIRQKTPLFSFVTEILQKWPYNAQITRPTHYSLIDQALGGLMKGPSVVCYIEKIVSYFLQQAAQINMSAFAFDDEGVNNEMQIKRQTNATFSLYNQQKPSRWDKFKGLFRKEKEEMNFQSTVSNVTQDLSVQDSFLSQNNQQRGFNTVQIARMRQTKFFQLIRNVALYILNQEMPIYLCRLLACFDKKLDKICTNKSQSRLKHYCYFLMTNLLLADLHNKFTISHQETVMSHAELQNISEIIKFLNSIFQGLLPESDKYKAKIPHIFNDIIQRVEPFYSNALSRGRLTQIEDGQLLQILLGHYQRSVVISINDLSLIIAMLEKAKPTTYLPFPGQFLEFLKEKEAFNLFDNSRKSKEMKYKGGVHSMQHIYIVYESRNPSMKEVIDFYLTADEPLTDIPLIREILLSSSNLQIQQTLEIEQDLKLIQKLPIKQLRGFLGKLAHKFRQLRVKDGRLLKAKFHQSFKSTLTRSLRRKQWLLYYKSSLNERLSVQSVLMNYFTGELNSAQFYERMATSFCESVRFKIYLNIENNIFKIHKTPQELKKIQISTLMVAKDDNKSNSSNENYILRNSFKVFENYKDLLRCISKNEITMMALVKGRQADEFNIVFQQMSNLIVGKIQQFIANRHIMQVLSQQKLGIIVVKKMQDYILGKFRQQNLPNQKDKELYGSSLKVNKQDFWKRDLQQYGLDRDFIVIQGVDKFRAMISEKNVWARLKHFSQLFKIIFTILGLIMAKNKISAEIVTPLVQYLILECAELKHHECLYSIQALRWRETPEDTYHLTLYQSSLTYIRELMPKDYPR